MDLSCASTTACMAVWGDYNGGGRARWWNGSTWKGTTLAGPSGAHFARGILSVSCATATSCTAVGALISGDPRNPAPLIEHWDGRAWTRTASARAASGHAALGGVACTAARVCTAVGFRQPGAAPFAEARTARALHRADSAVAAVSRRAHEPRVSLTYWDAAQDVVTVHATAV
jgi:hypothetical protein